MVAFEILGWPIYRYGIFYLITFVVGYAFLWRVGRQSFLDSYPRVQWVLQQKVDDLYLMILLGVIVGGRLGHVLLYEGAYYLQHPLETFYLWQGGMSFVGGVIGVTVGLIWLIRRWQLKRDDVLLLGDLILCIVPLGILLGRIGNSLNQELIGKPLSQVGAQWRSWFSQFNLTRVYDQRDDQLRVDTNLIQSGLEGGLLLIVTWSILLGRYLCDRFFPGMITGLFLIGYSLVRWWVEQFKDLPSQEVIAGWSRTQRMMIVFFIAGVVLLVRKKRGAARQ